MPEVEFDVRDRTAIITLARPEARNAVTLTMFRQITECVARAETEGLRALVIVGSGSYFCAGLDLKALQSASGDEETVFGEVLRAGNEMIMALGSTGLVSVSAVEGGAVGGGLGLALGTDLCVAGRSARFSTQYVKVGMSPDIGVSYHLTRRLGPAGAAALLLHSPVQDAETALAAGLIDQVVPDGEVLESALQLAGEIATRSATAIAGIRDLTGSATSNTLAEQLQAEQEWIRRCWEDPAAQRYARAFTTRKADPGSWSSSSGLNL